MDLPQTEIDWERLGEIQDWNMGWRTAFPSLSSIYVSGEGDRPKAMLFGEAPGAQEELNLRPFVGPAGMVLRELMSFCGLYADPWHVKCNCWLTNVVKFRPPRNRTPSMKEILVAREGLRWEWETIGRPSLIIPVGGVALTALTGRPMSILRWSGRLWEVSSRTTGQQLYVWPMIHPSFGLRQPAMRDLLEKDWLNLGAWLNYDQTDR